MKKTILASAVAIATVTSQAEYIIKYPVEKSHIQIVNGWQATTPEYSNWIESAPSNCNEWSPLPESVVINSNFTQSRNCTVNETRTVQQRQKMGNEYRNVGEATTESRDKQISENRTAVGTAVSWVSTDALVIQDWTNNGTSTCQTWSPNLADYSTSVDVLQTSNDCSQPQNRIIQNREQEVTTLEYRNVGSQVTENRTLQNQTETRTMKGTKVTKACVFDQSFAPNVYQWYSGYFWMTAYQDIPEMWIDTATGRTIDFGGGSAAIPGLTKISATEFRYAAASGTWKITMGSLVTVQSGYSYYQICFEK